MINNGPNACPVIRATYPKRHERNRMHRKKGDRTKRVVVMD